MAETTGSPAEHTPVLGASIGRLLLLRKAIGPSQDLTMLALRKMHALLNPFVFCPRVSRDTYGTRA